MTLFPATDLEPLLREFEAAWARGVPNLTEFLRVASPYYRAAARELVLIDMEYRANRGELSPTEEYLAQVPELREDADVVAELVATEFRLRHRMAGLREEDFVRRFPEHRHTVAARLGVRDDELLGPIRPETRLGRYRLHEIVGRGAFGTVFRATDEGLQRTVAVKVLRNVAPDSHEVSRFLREAHRGGSLRHPNLVPVFDAGVDRGIWYLVSEFVTGRTLVGEGPCEFRRAVELVAAVADALDVVHRGGIVHRDIKPANIMLDSDDRPRLTDFGLASVVDQSSSRSGSAWGTPAYQPPETLLGESHTIAGDVYSLGSVLYELLTGQAPYRGTATEILHQVASNDPTHPQRLRPELPRDLDSIVMTAMARTPRQRYPSAAALATDLRRWLAGEFVFARSPSWLERGQRWVRRNPARAGLSLTLLAVVAIAVGTLSWQWRTVLYERDRAEVSFRLAHHAVNNLAHASNNSTTTETVADLVTMYPYREEVIRYYAHFVRERATDPTFRRELANAHWTLANHSLLLQRRATYLVHAEAAWRHYQQVEALNADDSASAIHAALATAEQLTLRDEAIAWARSSIERFTLRWPESIHLQMLAVRVKLLVADGAARESILASLAQMPINSNSDRRSVVQHCVSLGASYAATDAPTALRLYRVGIHFTDALLVDSRESNDHALAAGVEQALGELMYNTLNDRTTAREHFVRADSHWTRWMLARTPNSDQDWAIAQTAYHLALMDNTPASRTSATTALRRAVASARESMRHFGETRVYRERLASGYHLLGKIGEPASREERMEWYRLAMTERERLCRDPEASDSDRTAYGLSLGRYGALCLDCDRNDEAARVLTKAVEIFSTLIDHSPHDLRLTRHINQCRLDLDRAIRRQLK